MDELPDIRPLIEKRCAFPMEWLRIVLRSEDVRISEMRRGFVFVYATWSGPSVVAFEKFTSVIKGLDAASLEIVVTSADTLTEELAKELRGGSGFIFGGYGETFWVRAGAVVAREGIAAGYESAVLEHTKSLLR